MALADVGKLVDALRQVDRLFENIRKLQAGEEALAARLRDIENRMTKLEADIPMVIVKAEAAAGLSASGAVMHHLVEMSRRLGALEEAVKHQSGPETKLLK